MNILQQTTSIEVAPITRSQRAPAGTRSQKNICNYIRVAIGRVVLSFEINIKNNVVNVCYSNSRQCSIKYTLLAE